ncbi:hypothetical protein C0989_006761 [Termitomyces sp. Mn162]|nr:hypothetical protein C0989_006761 [Termitomyces sp. Mn162]
MSIQDAMDTDPQANTLTQVTPNTPIEEDITHSKLTDLTQSPDPEMTEANIPCPAQEPMLRQRENDFPPLPKPTPANAVLTDARRPGRVRLVFGHGQSKEQVNSKCPQPTSPMKDRTPKRHTSTADPPLGTLERLPNLDLSYELSPTPPYRAQSTHATNDSSNGNTASTANYPIFSFSEAFTSGIPQGNSWPATAPGPRVASIRDSMDIDGGFHDQSTTVIVDSAWDDILNESTPPPTSQPSNIQKTIPPAMASTP